jgi:hypothetical protein
VRHHFVLFYFDRCSVFTLYNLCCCGIIDQVKVMTDKLYADPTSSWGSVPEATSREVGWFVSREADASKVRRSSAQKWRFPKSSCAETLYATEYVKFAGASPYSSKGRAADK